MAGEKEVDSLYRKHRADPKSPYWKKKYTLLLKKAENVEKQNLRLINRLYHVKEITKTLKRERRFLMKQLDRHKDDFRDIKFYQNLEVLPEGCSDFRTSQIIQKTSPQVTDPAQPPKKPLNAFLRYCNSQRQIVLNENPGITHQDLTKLISVNWNNLDMEEKQVYFDMFEKDKVRYDKELKIYQERLKKEEEMKNEEEQTKNNTLKEPNIKKTESAKNQTEDSNVT